jgi:hypothetical protein
LETSKAANYKAIAPQGVAGIRHWLRIGIPRGVEGPVAPLLGTSQNRPWNPSRNKRLDTQKDSVASADAYLLRLRSALSGLPAPGVEEILREFRSHILERQEAGQAILNEYSVS